MENLLNNSDEDITPLKRKRRKDSTKTLNFDQEDNSHLLKNGACCSNSLKDKIPEEKLSVGNVKCLETNKGTEVETVKKYSSVDCNSLAQQDGMFCSRNLKPDMQYFKPKNLVEMEGQNMVFCPVCKIHLRFIHGKSPQAHINECLDQDPEFEKGIIEKRQKIAVV